ncbi:hypothetical protein CHS0354_023774 [Potamilus streckersoni]|uniref:UDP-N-acetylmuramyl-tripeptide synthetase n=1 Tax=Potamilus streckersoni TaxID=2493646 RepID=A0AAE0RZL0_9BIVA|nr:hypothetical protein CHS0354_023774 [Potamilus streckersoni]
MNKTIKGIYANSKEVRENNSLFVSIKGAKADGNDFICEAIENGARIIVCEILPEKQNERCLYIKVPDSRKVLASLASEFYSTDRTKLKLIGITGTNGKTTVATQSRRVLELMWNTKVGFIGTIGFSLSSTETNIPQARTTPEAIEIHRLLSTMSNQGVAGAVLEVSSHALELDRVYGMLFDVAVFTNLSQDHLDFHSSMDSYFLAKSKLFTMLKEPTGKAVINGDDVYGKCLSAKRMIRYGLDNSNDLTAEIKHYSIRGTDVIVRWQNERVSLRLPLIGMFNVYNSLASMGVGLSLGGCVKDVAEGIEQVTSIDGRMQIFCSKNNVYAVIDYAHTPDGLEKAINSIKRIKQVGSKIITVFGCGGDRDKSKRSVMGNIASTLSDMVVLTADNSRSEKTEDIVAEIEKGIHTKKNVRKVLNREDAIKDALSLAKSNDVVFIAGKGHEMYQEFDQERIFFDDREIVKKEFALLC